MGLFAADASSVRAIRCSITLVKAFQKAKPI
jgi:hypothetical protein